MYNPTAIPQMPQMNQQFNMYQNIGRASYINPYTTYNYTSGNKVVGNVNSYNMYSSKVGVSGYYQHR
jgi:hypothetical protein